MGFLEVVAARVVGYRKERDGGSGLSEEQEQQEARCGSSVSSDKNTHSFPFFLRPSLLNK